MKDKLKANISKFGIDKALDIFIEDIEVEKAQIREDSQFQLLKCKFNYEKQLKELRIRFIEDIYELRKELRQ